MELVRPSLGLGPNMLPGPTATLAKAKAQDKLPRATLAKAKAQAKAQAKITKG